MDIKQIEQATADYLAKTGQAPRLPPEPKKAPGRPKGPRGIAREQMLRDLADPECAPEWVTKTYNAGYACFKCKTTERYITSGSCVECSRAPDLRSDEDKINGVPRTLKDEARQARQAALNANEKRYIGQPCKKCESRERFTSNSACVSCAVKSVEKARNKDSARFHHDTSLLMFVERPRQVPEVYAMCPELNAYPDYALVFTDQMRPKRLIGEDAMLHPDELSKIHNRGRADPAVRNTEHYNIINKLIPFPAMQYAWKLFNIRKMKGGS